MRYIPINGRTGEPMLPVRYLDPHGTLLWASSSGHVPSEKVGESFTSQYVDYTVEKIKVVKGIEQITLRATNICEQCHGLTSLFGKRDFTVMPPLLKCSGHGEKKG